MGRGSGKTRQERSSLSKRAFPEGGDTITSLSVPSRADTRPHPLIPSEATERELSDYSSGFCHLFALAMHQNHGWQIRGIGEFADEYSSWPWKELGGIPNHIYCLNHQGLPVDANGAFASEQDIQQFYRHQHEGFNKRLVSVDVTEEDIRGELVERGYKYIDEQELEQNLKVVKRLKLDALEA